MPTNTSPPATVARAPQQPFLLTPHQGEAARTLLSYVASLPLPGPEAQLLAVVVAIRAARGGSGNLTGQDLAGLRLGDARGAVDAVRGLGWQVDEVLFEGDPSLPHRVTVPQLSGDADRPLPFGKQMRARVSGWTTRGMTVKPLKKLPPAARLAGLFLAAHSTPAGTGQLPAEIPDVCRDAVPQLHERGFLDELSEDHYRLAREVRHLSGLQLRTGGQRGELAAGGRSRSVKGRRGGWRFDEAAWARWKRSATPALRRHVEAVEYCALCTLSVEQVANAFMVPARVPPPSQQVKAAYGAWKGEHPDRGREAAEYTLAFRAEHGHGPSQRQLCLGLGWTLTHPLRGFVVQRLLINQWLANTAPTPWTLRPGPAAQAEGIILPRARGPIDVSARRQT